MLNLDTHILVLALLDQVPKRERQILRKEQWSISAIVLWELAKLSQLGRIELDLNSPELSRLLPSIHIWPLTLEICRASTELDFESDPADELIAATSIVHKVPLLTHDRTIRSSRMTPLAY